MGALPIHSDMASIREWVDDGDNGLLFPVDDIDALERAIARGLSDDDLFNRAAQRNRELVDARLNRNRLRAWFATMIDRILLRGQTIDESKGPDPLFSHGSYGDESSPAGASAPRP